MPQQMALLSPDGCWISNDLNRLYQLPISIEGKTEWRFLHWDSLLHLLNLQPPLILVIHSQTRYFSCTFLRLFSMTNWSFLLQSSRTRIRDSRKRNATIIHFYFNEISFEARNFVRTKVGETRSGMKGPNITSLHVLEMLERWAGYQKTDAASGTSILRWWIVDNFLLQEFK